MPSPPKKPDFSNVKSSVKSTETIRPQADFSNVQSSVTSTEQVLGGDGGGGGTMERSYTVVKGDSLSRIAKKFYGRASRWHAIYDANREQLDDPDKIFPGQVLKIPLVQD